MKKVSIIGSGHVGAITAYLLALRGTASILLLDVVEGLPQGTALDMMESAPLLNFKEDIKGSNSFADIAGSDLVVVTAGQARRPGMSRSDLLADNVKVISSVVKNIVEYAPQTMILVVTNPVDIMTYLTYRQSRFISTKVFGMGGTLDSSRMAYFIASTLSVPVEDVEVFVIGSHSDAMLPLTRLSQVKGQKLTDLMDEKAIDNIIDRTKQAGAEIVSFLKTGSAFYAPAASIVRMIESVFRDEKRVFSTCIYLDGQYGFKDLCLNVPVQLGTEGVERIIELDLSEKEREALEKSAELVREGIRELKTLIKMD